MEQKWDLSSQMIRSRNVPWGWRGDGILTWLGANDELVQFTLKAKVPVVDFSSRQTALKIPRVLEDHAHAAKLVVEHFLARQFQHFAFYSNADCCHHEERGQHFVRHLQESGHECAWLRWHQPSSCKADTASWKRCQHWLANQLRQAPKPLIVFSANDQHALEVLDACGLAKISVPGEVAIVGAGNYLLAPDALRIPISSIDTNLEEVGYRGARLLDELMSGKPTPQSPIRVPAAGLVARKSSEMRAVKHPGVGNCLRYIDERLGQPIAVADLKKVAALSRRGLQQAFLEHLGHTPMQQVRLTRIEHGKKLLAASKIQMREIAGQCGYRNARTFFAAFTRQTDMSPNAYRRISQAS